MESFEHKNPNNEPSAEELEFLLERSYKLIGDIITYHADEHDALSATIPVTTPEAEAQHKRGELTVKDVNGSVCKILINESNYLSSEDSTVELYRLCYYPEAGFDLFASGAQPDVMEDVLDNNATYPDFEKAVKATDEYLHDCLRPASPAEMLRLMYVLEIGALTNAPIDFDEQFEKQFEQHPE